MPELHKETEASPRYYVKVTQHMDNIHLVLVAKNGQRVSCGNILTIARDGHLKCHAGIDRMAAEKAGIQVDGDGRIKREV